jgi:hypothetical protein
MKRVNPGSAKRRVDAIAARAREEAAPTIDVSQAVLRRLRRSRATYASERPMVWMAAGAIATAAIVVILSVPYLDAALDPLTLFLEEAASSAI